MNLGWPNHRPPDPDDGEPKPAVIDERYFMEWVDLGLEAISVRLQKQAAFDAWCTDNPRQEEETS